MVLRFQGWLPGLAKKDRGWVYTEQHPEVQKDNPILETAKLVTEIIT